MSKKLKIRFVKFEKALAMQILEQEGSFRDSEHVYTGFPELCCDRIYLCDEEERGNLVVSERSFVTNAGRDEYLKNVIRWISEEQFGAGSRELKVGELCEVRDYDHEEWEKRRLLAILPERFKNRYIVKCFSIKNAWTSYKDARPFQGIIEPAIDGDVYTWKIQGGEK